MSENTADIAAADPVPVVSSTRQRSVLILIAAAVIVLDQISKLIIESSLALFESWAPIPAIEALFRITRVSNTGMSFGLFPSGSPIFAWAAVIVALAIILYNYRLSPEPRWLRVALGLQLGGALGNLIDRLRIGHVTDFLDFGPWPVFNLADLSVITGAVLLAWLFWQEERKRKAESTLAADASESSQRQGETGDEPSLLDEWSTG